MAVKLYRLECHGVEVEELIVNPIESIAVGHLALVEDLDGDRRTFVGLVRLASEAYDGGSFKLEAEISAQTDDGIPAPIHEWAGECFRNAGALNKQEWWLTLRHWADA